VKYFTVRLYTECKYTLRQHTVPKRKNSDKIFRHKKKKNPKPVSV